MVDYTDEGGDAALAGVGRQPRVTSPYATGSGGGTLEARIATSYLADMLLGHGRPEAGDLPVVRVAFQTNPDPVDDLRVVGERDGRRVVVHVSVRRRPDFVKSDTKTAKLVGDLLDQIDQFGEDEDSFVAVAFAGMTTQFREVQELASMARLESAEAAFYEKVTLLGKFKGFPGRYGHLVGLVRAARPGIASDDDARDVVWALLRRLWMRDFRVESGDETDWVIIANNLNELARDGKTGADVRDEIYSAGATQFAQKGSEVDAAVLRRQLHTVLGSGRGRSAVAWTQLAEEQKSALVAVQHSLAGAVELPRGTLRAQLQVKLVEAGAAATAVIITGESGTGKSALTMSAAEQLAAANDQFEFVALNLRRTRDSVVELSGALGKPFAEVLREMSATSRVLIVDAADAALEGRDALLRELAAAAVEASVGLVLVAADTALPDVKAALAGLFPEPREVEVPGLDDEELKYVSSRVPAISGALMDLPPKSLYRRFVVVDLLARTGSTVSTTMDEWGCLALIWSDLVDRASPGKSNGEARTQSLLALSEEALNLPADDRMYPQPNPDAVNALRQDRLVAPRNLMKAEADFGHDEIRRFATAIRLAQATSLTDTLLASGPMRWAMSAAKLACQGKLANSDNGGAKLVSLVAEFDALGDGTRPRWKDVPLEAALEMSNAFDLMKHLLHADPDRVKDVLATFIRVVSVHYRHEDMIEVTRGEPVVRLAVEMIDTPWHREDEAFLLLRDWLHSAVLGRVPAGNSTRTALRTRLLEHWGEHYVPREARPDTGGMEAAFNVFEGHINNVRRRRVLPREITIERFVELLALLGPDINADVVACLRAIADESAEDLQPAVDKSWCAWAIALHDPQLLLELTEIYYIDPGPGRGRRYRRGRRYSGIREHEFRTIGQGLSGYGLGPFWVMMRFTTASEWVPVLNRILNHAVKVRDRNEDRGDSPGDATSFTLGIDGTERTYFGDAASWAWYRGTVNGPYPCMSALQAVERWIDDMVAAGIPVKAIVNSLLNACDNLAMVGLIVGSIIRHLDKEPETLIPYLREPLVWQFDSIRVTYDTVGLGRAPDSGVANTEMRSRSIRDIANLLVLGGDSRLRDVLKQAGDDLVANTSRFDAGEATVRGWAASLDAANIRTEPAEDGYVLVTFEEPNDVEAEVAPMRADFARYNELLGIQNKYWIPDRHKPAGWNPPTPIEIAADLAVTKNLYENPPAMAGGDPIVVASVAAAAVKAAADGHAEAFGDNAAFAITTVLGILASHADSGEPAEDTLAFETDLGVGAAASAAVPLLLLPALAEQLEAAGATIDDITEAAATLGTRAHVGACLHFARGCDNLWNHPCIGDPCIHAIAYRWVFDLARVAEIGEFDYERQRSPHRYIDGDVMARIAQIRLDHLDTPRLSATIRALGYASSTHACIADTANEALAKMLTAQAAAMVAQETDGSGPYFIDDNDAQTISAARALLHNLTNTDATANGLLVEYLTILTPAPHLISAFLRDLAAVGAETQQLAYAAHAVWPTVISHVLDQVEVHRSIYDTNISNDTFADFALSHLLPNLDNVPDGLHSELARETFPWMDAEQLAKFIPRWLPWAAGRSRCLFEVVRFLRKLPLERQVTDGLGWITDLCTLNPARQLATDGVMNEWLVEIKPEADARGAGEEWLNLIDRLVSAGNRDLASYSR